MNRENYKLVRSLPVLGLMALSLLAGGITSALADSGAGNQEITELPRLHAKIVATSDITFKLGEDQKPVGEGILLGNEACVLFLNQRLAPANYLLKKDTELEIADIHFSYLDEGKQKITCVGCAGGGYDMLVDWPTHHRARYDITFKDNDEVTLSCVGSRIKIAFDDKGGPVLPFTYYPISIDRLNRVLDSLQVRLLGSTVEIGPDHNPSISNAQNKQMTSDVVNGTQMLGDTSAGSAR